MKEKYYSKSITFKDQASSFKIKQQVAFPDFVNSQHRSFRPLHSYQSPICSKSLTESQEWSHPGNVGPLCYYDTIANEACVDFK